MARRGDSSPNSVAGYAFGMTEEWPEAARSGSDAAPRRSRQKSTGLGRGARAGAPAARLPCAKLRDGRSSEVVFLGQIILLLSVGRLMGEVMCE